MAKRRYSRKKYKRRYRKQNRKRRSRRRRKSSFGGWFTKKKKEGCPPPSTVSSPMVPPPRLPSRRVSRRVSPRRTVAWTRSGRPLSKGSLDTLVAFPDPNYPFNPTAAQMELLGFPQVDPRLMRSYYEDSFAYHDPYYEWEASV